jgi:hypothetical protein
MLGASCTKQQSSETPSQNKVEEVNKPAKETTGGTTTVVVPKTPPVTPAVGGPTGGPGPGDEGGVGFSGGGGGGGGSHGGQENARTGNPDNDPRFERLTCQNNIQEIIPTLSKPCPGLLYGVSEVDEDISTRLVRIDHTTGEVTDVGPLDFEANGPDDNPSFVRFVGIDFSSQGNLYALAVLNENGSSDNELWRFTINCLTGAIEDSSEVTGFSQFETADGFTIDPNGVGFSIINDNTGGAFASRLAKVGYETFADGDGNSPAVILTPPVSPTISVATDPLGLDASGFPSPNTLFTGDATKICALEKTSPVTPSCNPYTAFNGFPADFSFDDFFSADQDFESLINYAIVNDNEDFYLAQVNFGGGVVTNIGPFTLTGGPIPVLGLAVSQLFEECDPTSSMEGTLCTPTCDIVETDCDDDIDNDMNGATDEDDPQCPDDLDNSRGRGRTEPEVPATPVPATPEVPAPAPEVPAPAPVVTEPAPVVTEPAPEVPSEELAP